MGKKIKLDGSYEITDILIRRAEGYNLEKQLLSYCVDLASLIGDTVRVLKDVEFHLDLTQGKFIIGYQGHEGATYYGYPLEEGYTMFCNVFNKEDERRLAKVIKTGQAEGYKEEEYKRNYTLGKMVQQLVSTLVNQILVQELKGLKDLQVEIEIEGMEKSVIDVTKRFRNKAKSLGSTKGYRRIINSIVAKNPRNNEPFEPAKEIDNIKIIYSKYLDDMVLLLETNQGVRVVEVILGVTKTKWEERVAFDPIMQEKELWLELVASLKRL